MIMVLKSINLWTLPPTSLEPFSLLGDLVKISAKDQLLDPNIDIADYFDWFFQNLQNFHWFKFRLVGFLFNFTNLFFSRIRTL